MKISYKWLKEYLNIELEPEQVADFLTSIGLETEGLERYSSIKGGLEGVVIGEVKECYKHPDADKLTVCKVDVGETELLNIVCGAPNVAPGQKVPVATVGSEIHPFESETSIIIRKAKIRGVASEGMICAEDELGISNSHDGIMVLNPDTTIGMAAADYFNVYTDHVFEIGLTPNRTDAMSHFGVARDLAASVSFRNKTNLTLVMPPADIQNHISDDLLPLKVQIDNTAACKRYSAIALSQVNITKSPQWLINRLRAIGIKPHNNVVDATNYVMHEIGHPLHAFDYDSIANGHIVVKNLVEGARFTTLEGAERVLSGGDLMICDPQKPLCIAGVYGGIASGVTDKTSKLVLESAWFDPVSVRRSARFHGLNTDASFRFERGTDPNITIFALKRAAALICEIAGAKVCSDLVDVGEYAHSFVQPEVLLRFDRTNMLIGLVIDKADLIEILLSLDFDIIEEKPSGLLLRVPSYRVDVTREVDVIEEVMRIFGMNNIPIPEKVSLSFPAMIPDKSKIVREKTAAFLVANGFMEVWNNSLTSSGYSLLLKDEIYDHESVKILNPLSQDLNVLRQTMLFGMLENARHNINRKWEDLSFFEFGATYHRIKDSSPEAPVSEQFKEIPTLALMLSGMKTTESWMQKSEAVGFYDIKLYVDEILRICGFLPDQIELINAGGDMFETGVLCMMDNQQIGRFGFLGKALRKHFGIKQQVLYAELSIKALADNFSNLVIKATALPRFPEVRRDLSLVLDKAVTFDQIRKLVLQSDQQLIRNVLLFDVYEAENLPVGKKSYAIGIIIQDMEKTLSDAEIDKTISVVVDNLNRSFGAVLR